MSHTLDTSAVLYAWENYPINQFPRLWDWIASEITSNTLSISDVALQETKGKSKDCHSWLKNRNIRSYKIDDPMVKIFENICHSLGITDGRFRGSGVCENDILIIAAAKSKEYILINNENRQPTRPVNIANAKIPLACMLHGVAECNVLEYLIKSKKVF